MLTYVEVPFKAMQTGEVPPAVGYSQYNWSLARWLVYSILSGIGDGIITGFHASVSAGNALIDASPDPAHVAIITDATGPVIVRTTADVTRLAADMTPDGAHYVYASLDATSRTAQTWAVGSQMSATPPTGAANICKATVAGGVVTAVDNTVKADPQIINRLFWGSGNLQYSPDDSATLVSAITDLRDAITNAWPYAEASSLHERVDALEGLGLGTTTYWGALQRALGDTQTVPAFVATEMASHLGSYHSGTGGDNNAGVVPLQTNFNEDAVNNMKQTLRLLHTDPLFSEDMIRFGASIPGIIGLDENGQGLFEDAAATTFRRDTGNHRYY